MMEILPLKQLKIAFLSPKCQFKKAVSGGPPRAGSGLSGCPGDVERVALLHRGAGSTGQEAGGLSLHLGYDCGECQRWNGEPSARPWGCAVSWTEAGERCKWAVDCRKDSADLVCLPCLKAPGAPSQVVAHPGVSDQCQGLLAWGQARSRWSGPQPHLQHRFALPPCLVTASPRAGRV